MRWIYIDGSARRTTIRIVAALGVVLAVWLWYGTIQPAYQKWGFRREVARQVKAATTDDQRAAAVNFNGWYVVFGDRRWLVVRYDESSIGAWALAIACDSDGHWYECDHRLLGCSRFHVDDPAAIKLSSLAGASDLPAARAMIEQAGFHQVAR